MAENTPSAQAQRGQWTTLSYAHNNPDELGSTTIQGKAPRLKRGFEEHRCSFNVKQLDDLKKTVAERRLEIEAFKAKRRGSNMVSKDRPKPVHKPSPQLARGSDRAAFAHDWGVEYRSAKRADRLEEAKAETTPEHSSAPGSKEAFKNARREQAESTRQSQSVQR